MKKTITVILLAAILLLSAGCDKSALTRGTVRENVYTDSMNGFTFAIPDGWYALTDEFRAQTFDGSMPSESEMKKYDSTNTEFFHDIIFWDTTNGKNQVEIDYQTRYKNKTDEQVMNLLNQFTDESLTFETYENITVSGVKWAIAHCYVGSTGLHNYYAWRSDVTKGFGEMLFIRTETEDMCDSIMACFSYAADSPLLKK